MADQVSSVHTDGLHERRHEVGQRDDRGARQTGVALPMAGQIERDHRVLLGQCVEVEHPVAEIAAEAVDEQHRHACLRAAPRITHANAVDLDEVECGGSLFVAVSGLGHHIRRDARPY